MINIEVINQSSNAKPTYATNGSAGIDLRADLTESITLKPFERKLIPTGIRIKLDEGYEAQVRPRSGLALKYGVTVLNTPGTIDSDYRGVIGVILINLGSEDFTINNNDRIAQLVVAKYEKANLVSVNGFDLNDTERGEDGFGHTGI